MPYINTHTPQQAQGIRQVNYDFALAKKENVTQCDLCGGHTFTIIAHHDRYHHEVKTMLCDCGNVFITPKLTRESAIDLYRGTYRKLISAWHGRDIGPDSVQLDQKIYSQELCSVLSTANVIDRSKIHSILDVGGSTGTVLKELEKWIGHDCRLVNIDPSSAETVLSGNKNITTVQGFVEDVAIGEQFDLVTMTWAVDHLHSISESFAKIRSCMKDHGFFWFDAMDLRKQILKTGSVEGAVKVDHNFYFTETVLEQYLAKAGLKIELRSISRDKWHIGFLCSKAQPNTIDLDLLKTERKSFYDFTRSLNEVLLDKRYR